MFCISRFHSEAVHNSDFFSDFFNRHSREGGNPDCLQAFGFNPDNPLEKNVIADYDPQSTRKHGVARRVITPFFCIKIAGQARNDKHFSNRLSRFNHETRLQPLRK